MPVNDEGGGSRQTEREDVFSFSFFLEESGSESGGECFSSSGKQPLSNIRGGKLAFWDLLPK